MDIFFNILAIGSYELMGYVLKFTLLYSIAERQLVACRAVHDSSRL